MLLLCCLSFLDHEPYLLTKYDDTNMIKAILLSGRLNKFFKNENGRERGWNDMNNPLL